jgi:RNA polymerase sigma-70 factor (sigma-E family)
VDDFADYMVASWRRLVRSLVLLGCEPHEAEDVVQTALISCYRSWSRVIAAGDPDAYVFQTVLNAWSKSRRRRWWGERPTEVLPETGAAVGDAVLDRRLVHQALAPLSKEHREVLVLKYVGDLTENQIATALAISVGTVKSRTARALAAIDALVIREDS